MTPLRVGLRVFYNPSWMGGVNYVLGLARMLRLLPTASRPYVALLYVNDQSRDIAEANLALADAALPFMSAEDLGLDFVYPATQLAEAPMNVAWAGWIPDWQCQHLPEFFDLAEQVRRKLQYSLLAEHSALCLCSSQMAIADTQKLLPEAGLRLRQLSFPANVPEEYSLAAPVRAMAAQEALGLPADYLIVCNQFWRHKNHLAVIQAVIDLGNEAPNVVMTGELEDARWPAYILEVQALLDHPIAQDKIHVTGRIPRDAQLALLAGARGLIQPSLFEGWSSFVEEGRALGIPQLLSDFPVHREQNPAGAVFFDPKLAGDLAAKILQLAQSAPEVTARDGRQCLASHNAFALRCAENFVALGRATAARWHAFENDPKAIAATQLAQLQAQIGNDLSQQDFDRFAAGVRQLFVPYPRELARLAQLICADEHPLCDQAVALILAPTLAKMTPAAQEIFLAYDPTTDPWGEAVRASMPMKHLTSRTKLQIQTRLLTTEMYHRMRDTLIRKLSLGQ